MATHQSKLRTDAMVYTLECLLRRVSWYTKRNLSAPPQGLAALQLCVDHIKREIKWWTPEERAPLRKLLADHGFEKKVS